MVLTGRCGWLPECYRSCIKIEWIRKSGSIHIYTHTLKLKPGTYFQPIPTGKIHDWVGCVLTTLAWFRIWMPTPIFWRLWVCLCKIIWTDTDNNYTVIILRRIILIHIWLFNFGWDLLHINFPIIKHAIKISKLLHSLYYAVI